MFGPTAAYVVAFSMLAFCGLTALTLINTVGRLDPPETDASRNQAHDNAKTPSSDYSTAA